MADRQLGWKLALGEAVDPWRRLPHWGNIKKEEASTFGGCLQCFLTDCLINQNETFYMVLNGGKNEKVSLMAKKINLLYITDVSAGPAF